ncbi:MAG: hypothetical protein JO281_09700 [Pseudonocardiales bacterium]|nr:hypothetical protein [Pseudonocardiales bacterium]MBV9161805.1 hypothetical protein [Pseudonocardiales bacterium]
MAVRTTSQEFDRCRAILTELLIADAPPREADPQQTTTGDNMLLALADRYGVSGETTALPLWGPAAVATPPTPRAGCRAR